MAHPYDRALRGVACSSHRTRVCALAGPETGRNMANRESRDQTTRRSRQIVANIAYAPVSYPFLSGVDPSKSMDAAVKRKRQVAAASEIAPSNSST